MNSATYTKQHLKISVIIPARNEAPNLQHVIPHIPQYIDEVLLIDGHSTDDTVAEARRLRPDVQIVEQVGIRMHTAGLKIAEVPSVEHQRIFIALR